MQAAWLHVLEMCPHPLASGQNCNSKPTASSFLSGKQDQRGFKMDRNERSRLWTGSRWEETLMPDGLRAPFLQRTAHSKQPSVSQRGWSWVLSICMYVPRSLLGKAAGCHCWDGSGTLPHDVGVRLWVPGSNNGQQKRFFSLFCPD